MTACNYDGIFHRVFCVALLAVAFTFTVILTNVFVDIDGLLSSKEKEHQIAFEKETINYNNDAYQTDSIQDREHNDFIKEKVPDMSRKEENNMKHDAHNIAGVENIVLPKVVVGIDNAHVKGESKKNDVVFEPNDTLDGQDFNELIPGKYDDYRSKRSIDTSINKFYKANPKMKERLKNRLSTLLKELDAEEKQTRLKDDKDKEAVTSEPPDVASDAKKNCIEEKNKNPRNVNYPVHKAIHEIILQGVINHMDLSDIYKKVNELTKGFEQANVKKNTNVGNMGHAEDKGTTNTIMNSYPENGQIRNTAKVFTEVTEAPQDVLSMESKIFDEMAKCDDLHKQIDVESHADSDNKRNEKNINNKKAPGMILKTIIDIKSLNQNKKIQRVNTNNIKGFIKLIYNGNPVKFSQMDDEESETQLDLEKSENKEDEENAMDIFINHALAQYLKKYPKLENKLKAQRPKRSIKQQNQTHKGQTAKPKQKKKPQEEELFVEIETHFDSKGINGEKKKKLVKNIIAKIQKALRKENVRTADKTKNTNRFKKRLLNPLTIKEEYSLRNKIIIPVENIVLRQIDPLSKSVKAGEHFPMYDRTGEEWRKAFTGSAFLSDMKSINSGETGQVDLDYNQVTQLNGLPQRLQHPLNSDNVRHFEADNKEYFNIGDLQFFIKDIDGTGFSIGFNQYVGEVPDPESIKTFTGLQHLLNAYNHNDDTKSNSEDNYLSDSDHEISKRDISTVSDLESIFSNNQATDYHSKDVNFNFEKYLPYDSFSETIDDGHKKVSIAIEKKLKAIQHKNKESVKTNFDADKRSENEYGNMPFIVDENLLKKPLNPSEILSLANLLERKKRSFVAVTKYSNLKKRGNPHINTYLNTHKRSKMIYKIRNRNQRSKRQVDKIRIIATDGMPRLSRHSDENIFVVTGDDMYADTGSVSDTNVPEQDQPENEEHNEFLVADHQLPDYNMFAARSRHNKLMSKYPHLFMEEITRSESDEERDNPSFYKNVMDHYGDLVNLPAPSPSVSPFETRKAEILVPSANYYESSDHRPNYKLTFKIIAKNHTDAPSGFKSVHTSINKTINRNGLLYLSQTNVSELSKIEHILNGDGQNSYNTSVRSSNLTKYQPPTENTFYMNSAAFPLVKHIKDQQEKMKLLLKQHKERIDEQLDSLKKEKQNLDTMIIHSCADETTTTAPEVKKPDLIEVLLPLNPPQMLHLDKQQAGQLISNALMKLHDTPNINDVNNQINPQQPAATTVTTTTEAKTTTQTTTTTQATTTIKMSTQDPVKTKLLHTIQRNENLTNTILNKIDRNTNLLQNFLEKLIVRLQPTRPPARPADFLIPEWTKPPPSKEWGEPSCSQSGNKTNKTALKTIPFVYAYQQQPSANNLAASVIYHGHIHTNTYNNEKDKFQNKRDTKQSFFLDDLEPPRYKPVQLPMRKQPYNILRIKSNTSRI